MSQGGAGLATSVWPQSLASPLAEKGLDSFSLKRWSQIQDGVLSCCISSLPPVASFPALVVCKQRRGSERWGVRRPAHCREGGAGSSDLCVPPSPVVYKSESLSSLCPDVIRTICWSAGALQLGCGAPPETSPAQTARPAPRPQSHRSTPHNNSPASMSKSAEYDFIDWRCWACRFSTWGRVYTFLSLLKQVVKWIVHMKET